MEKQYESGWELDEATQTWRPPAVLPTFADPRTTADNVLPAGMMMPYAAATAPIGWLLCDGAAVSRQTYRRLFSIIGTTYGTGDGSTTFNLPNLKGRIIVGVDAAQTEFDVLGETGGSKSIVTGAVPAHTHGYGHTHGMNTVDTNHAHNVYTTGAINTWWMTQNNTHWHIASIGNVGYNYAVSHAHHDRGGVASEAPWEDYRFPGGSVPVNVNSTDTNHQHDFAHNHPSTNYASESPWAGNYTHAHTTNSQNTSTTDSGTGGASAAGNMPPYMAMNYCIKT